jgi:protein transport protein SEC24
MYICFTGFSDETPRDYHCNLGPDGRRRDADEKPELCRGTVEFVATKEFMVSLFIKNTCRLKLWIY